MSTILVVGCGDIGYRVATALQQQGHDVTGLKRTPVNAWAPFPIICADIRQASSLTNLPKQVQQVLFIVSAVSRQAEAYRALYHDGLRNLLNHFAQSGQSPNWLMVSSTSVYGQNQGEWVDEESETLPGSASSLCLLEAEQILAQRQVPYCVVRFSGIYGPGRDWLLRRAASGEKIQQQPPYYTNRIHQDDCVGVLLFLIQKQLAGEILAACYVASDHDPAPLWDVMNWIARQYAFPAPSALDGPIDASSNKRCSNAKLLELGYRFLYSGYREGYIKADSHTIG